MRYFIFGILFISCLPILDGLVETVVQAIQFMRAKIAIKTLQLNKEIQKYEQDKQQEKHYGFVALPEPQPIVVQEEEDCDE